MSVENTLYRFCAVVSAYDTDVCMRVSTIAYLVNLISGIGVIECMHTPVEQSLTHIVTLESFR